MYGVLLYYGNLAIDYQNIYRSQVFNMEQDQLENSASELGPQTHPQVPLTLSTTDTKEPTVATINAATLVDIINSVATATGETSEGAVGEAMKPGLQIQLQVHGLNKDGQGEGKAAKKTGRGKHKQAWHYHLGTYMYMYIIHT